MLLLWRNPRNAAPGGNARWHGSLSPAFGSSSAACQQLRADPLPSAAGQESTSGGCQALPAAPARTRRWPCPAGGHVGAPREPRERCGCRSPCAEPGAAPRPRAAALQGAAALRPAVPRPANDQPVDIASVHGFSREAAEGTGSRAAPRAGGRMEPPPRALPPQQQQGTPGCAWPLAPFPGHVRPRRATRGVGLRHSVARRDEQLAQLAGMGCRKSRAVE